MESGFLKLECDNFLSYWLIKESKIVRMVMTLEVAEISKIAENREFFLFYKIIIIQKPCIIEERMTHYFKGVQMSFKMTCHMTLYSHLYLVRNTKRGNFCNGAAAQGLT